jgi:hypothetical protein
MPGVPGARGYAYFITADGQKTDRQREVIIASGDLPRLP